MAVKGKAINDVSRLTGPEKAAVVLLSLGEEHTALWERLEEDVLTDQGPEATALSHRVHRLSINDAR